MTQKPLILPFRGVMPKIAPDAFIAPNATIIGNVEIGAQSSIWFSCVLRADDSYIRIGARSNIQDGSIVHESSAPLPTIIGDDVLVGHMVVLHACTLESGAFIGMRSVILDGAVVEGGAMLAAGALLGPGKRVPKGELWGGTPARFMRKLNEREMEELNNGAAHYVEHATEYRKMLGS